jgi:hypothetical protein
VGYGAVLHKPYNEAMLSLTKILPAIESETKAKLDHCINNFQFQYLTKIIEEKIGSNKGA